MTASTILTMANGKGVDLDAVTAADVDFDAFAEHVAKEARFNGATPDEIYFVGQHLCEGTDLMLASGETNLAAAYFHLHDLPEGIWKDDPTPKKRTLAKRIADRCGVTAESILDVLREIDSEHERAVHEAAGLPYPVPPEIHAIVKKYDMIMFVAEWNFFMGRRGIMHPAWDEYSAVRQVTLNLKPWSWMWCKLAWLDRARKLLPALQTGSAKQ